MSDSNLILSPTDFVAFANQALDYAFGIVQIEGELANFRISKNKWVYFDVKDDISKVACFASIYAMPGPLKDGMLIKIAGHPKLHPQFGFSITVQNIQPSGEGSIKKAFDLLKASLIKEGLFELSRKRPLIYPPQKIALITSVESAAYADFIKIINARWPFVFITVYDIQVQGVDAPAQVVKSINTANLDADYDVLVVTRGGGSADDLAAFNDERVVRAIASSRIPTLVAIGHEIDESLSELAADKRASTPSNAAELLVPNRHSELESVLQSRAYVNQSLQRAIDFNKNFVTNTKNTFTNYLWTILEHSFKDLKRSEQLLGAYNPNNVLKRGYSIVRYNGKLINNSNLVKLNDFLNIQLYNGGLEVKVEKIDDKL